MKIIFVESSINTLLGMTAWQSKTNRLELTNKLNQHLKARCDRWFAPKAPAKTSVAPLQQRSTSRLRFGCMHAAERTCEILNVKALVRASAAWSTSIRHTCFLSEKAIFVIIPWNIRNRSINRPQNIEIERDVDWCKMAGYACNTIAVPLAFQFMHISYAC